MDKIDMEACFKDIEEEHKKMEMATEPAKRAFQDDPFIIDTTLADILGLPQEYLFVETILSQQVGVMPRGEPCMIAAPGGTGKSFLALACAIASASGTAWLHYQAKKPVKTIFIGAEDNQNTIGNRFYRLLRGLNIHKNPVVFETMKRNIAVWGKKGTRMPLIDDKGKETEIFEDLKYRIQQEGDVGLVILDPARSFMARDTESDNGAASEWKDIICSLTELPSRPTVLVTHHTNKSAIRGNGKDSAPTFDQSSVRGASALVDGFRWILNMQKVYEDDERKIFIKIGKSNFSDDGNATEWRLNYEDGGIFQQVFANKSSKKPDIISKRFPDDDEEEERVFNPKQESLMDSIRI